MKHFKLFNLSSHPENGSGMDREWTGNGSVRKWK